MLADDAGRWQYSISLRRSSSSKLKKLVKEVKVKEAVLFPSLICLENRIGKENVI